MGLQAPRSLAFDRDGNLYIGEFAGLSIRKVAPNESSSFFAPHDANRFIGGIRFRAADGAISKHLHPRFGQTGQGVTIAGFIVTGTDSKTVVLRGLGPTLSQPPFNILDSPCE